MAPDPTNAPAPKPFLRYLATGLSILLAAGLVLYALAGFVLVPKLIKQHLEGYVAQHLQRQLVIQEIEFNPFSFLLRVDGLELLEREGARLASLQFLEANLSAQALLQGEINIEEVMLQAPWLNFDRRPDGGSNLNSLIEDISSQFPAEEKPQAESAPLPLSIDRVDLINGILEVADRSGATPARTHVSPINLSLRDISLTPGEAGSFSLTAYTENGGKLVADGKLEISPVRVTGKVSLRGSKPILLWNFLRDELAIDEPQGLIDFNASYQMAVEDDQLEFSADQIGFAIKGLEIRKRDASEPILRMRDIALSDGSFSLDGNRLRIGGVHIGDGLLRVIRKQTLLDWQTIWSKATTASDRAEKDSPDGAVPWLVALQQVDFEKIEITFEDQDLVTPLTSQVGEFSVVLNAEAAQDETGLLQVEVGDINATLAELSLIQAGATEPLVSVVEAKLEGGKVNLGAKTLFFDSVRLQGGGGRIERAQSGKLNWSDVFVPKPALPDPVASEQPAPDAAAHEQPAPDASPWQVDIASSAIDGFRLDITDQGSGKPLKLVVNPASLHLGGISSKLDKPVELQASLTLESGGSVSAKGQVEPAQAAGQLNIEVADLVLTPAQPYLQSIAKISLDSGRVSSQGRLVVAAKGTSLSYGGGLRIDDLVVTEPGAGGVLAGWKSLNAATLNLNTSPGELEIDEIKLNAPKGRFIIKKDLSTNWQDIFVPQAEGTRGGGPAKQDDRHFQVNVGRIAVENGELDFSDLSLPLDFSAQIRELTGVVANVSTSPGTRAGSNLKGRVDQFGSAKIEGELDLFDPLLFTDIAVSFENLEMESLTPYTVKFAGHAIESGRLSLDLKYGIDKRQLKGDNQILINSLVLGEKVESPDAIDAPLELAIALLQDTEGRIDLGLPVSGDLDDPKFSYGHLVWKALGNLLTKIVTAPFRALGAAMGVEGENLDTVFFEPGQYALSPPEQEKLRSVAKILSKRPQLTLELQGSFNYKFDADALKSRQLDLEISRRMGKKQKKGAEPDPVSLSDRATRTALEKLFAERFSATELKKIKAGAPGKQKQEAKKQASVKDERYSKMYARLVSAQKLPKSALTELAIKRGEVISQELTGPGKLPPQRIKLGDPVAMDEGGSKERVTTRLNLAVAK